MTPTTHELLRATTEGDTNRVRALLATGADANSTNRASQTALMLAAAFKRTDIVKLLLAAGARVDVADELGLTAVDWANNDAEIVALIAAARVKQAPVQAPVDHPSAIADESGPTAHRATGTERLPDAAPLKGLAGAILRDHKPRATPVAPAPVPVEPPVEILPEVPAEVPAEVPPEPLAKPRKVRKEPDPLPLFSDETLDQKIDVEQPASDDTLSPSVAKRGRIFDIEPDPLPPVSKVEIDVPEPPKRGVGRKVFGFLLLLVILSAVAFGVYRYFKLSTPSSPQPAIVTSTPTPAPSPVATPHVQQTTVTAAPPRVTGALAGTELHLAEAEFPAGAKQSGTVAVKVRVSKKGIVVAANAIDGDEALRNAAEAAARSSAFSPEKLDDKGTFTEGTITYTFVASQGAAASGATLRNEVTAKTGGPLAGKERRLIKPDYPAEARRDGISGTVTVVVRVDNTGRAVSWRPLDGDETLRAAAIKAVRLSTFVPNRDNDIVGTITYTFR